MSSGPTFIDDGRCWLAGSDDDAVGWWWCLIGNLAEKCPPCVAQLRREPDRWPRRRSGRLTRCVCHPAAVHPIPNNAAEWPARPDQGEQR